MSSLINICEQFSLEYSISFNDTKSKHIFFSHDSGDSHVTFQMQGKDIPKVSSDLHLGNLIGPNTFKDVITNSINEIYRNVNILCAQFYTTDVDVKYRLFKSYCMAVYGSQLWDYSSKLCELFYTAWRKCIRRLIGVSYKTHNRYLHLICGDVPVNIQLLCRFANFANSCYNSKCEL